MFGCLLVCPSAYTPHHAHTMYRWRRSRRQPPTPLNIFPGNEAGPTPPWKDVYQSRGGETTQRIRNRCAKVVEDGLDSAYSLVSKCLYPAADTDDMANLLYVLLMEYGEPRTVNATEASKFVRPGRICHDPERMEQEDDTAIGVLRYIKDALVSAGTFPHLEMDCITEMIPNPYALERTNAANINLVKRDKRPDINAANTAAMYSKTMPGSINDASTTILPHTYGPFASFVERWCNLPEAAYAPPPDPAQAVGNSTEAAAVMMTAFNKNSSRSNSDLSDPTNRDATSEALALPHHFLDVYQHVYLYPFGREHFGVPLHRCSVEVAQAVQLFLSKNSFRRLEASHDRLTLFCSNFCYNNRLRSEVRDWASGHLSPSLDSLAGELKRCREQTLRNTEVHDAAQKEADNARFLPPSAQHSRTRKTPS